MVQIKRSEGIEFNFDENSFRITWNGKLLLQHSKDAPLLYVGHGEESVEMYRGNFKIEDYVVNRVPLKIIETKHEGEEYIVIFGHLQINGPVLEMRVSTEVEKVEIRFNEIVKNNRFWIRLNADEAEKVYGCGEQLSHFNLRGKNFPLWTSEPGVGRNKSTYTTWQADVMDRAGGDYYTTNYPQPTFISSNKYYCHVETTMYADFNFKNAQFHELHIWEVPKSIRFEGSDNYLKLMSKLSDFLGRQPALPDWVYDGIILGIQGGTKIVEEKLKVAQKAGIKVAGVWCQDWQGKRITSFGKRLMWNWEWDAEMYPNLDAKISEWKDKGVKFLGYINPYVAIEGNLFKLAESKGYLALTTEGKTYLVDFGEFYCGIVDFTNEEAFSWYKSVIKVNLIDFGLDGWMADFGEYLPTDVVLANNKSAMEMHNAWPTLWAKVNYEAVNEKNKIGEIVYFMRAGYTGVQEYNTLLWAGDQSVIWEKDDGLASVIPAALSAGVSGMGITHSDIGGYTSLHGNKRSKELLLRWVEMAAFTPFMRTHEGNRPDDCFQYDSDDTSLALFARMTSIFVALKPYMKSIVELNANEGIPVQRPLFFHYDTDERSYDIQYEYLLGEDVLVSPVYEEGKLNWTVYLPEDEWIHVWSGESYNGGEEVEVSALMGYPPVFYRKNSKWLSLFNSLKEI